VIAILLAAVLDLASYRARLEQIDALLARGDRAGAAAGARALLADSVRAEGEDLSPDAWTLSPIARGEPHRARLRGLLEALGARSERGPGEDRALLDSLVVAQAERDRGGGEIRTLPVEELSFVGQLREWVKAALRWTGRRLLDFLHWLWGLFPRGADAGVQAAGRITRVVFIGVGVILVLVVALGLGTARRAPLPAAGGGSRRPAKDEDPLSRTASGWEDRALDLAREGRAREAIRAWYHAILVRSYAAGILHYRRGRTNWEYMRALSPSIAWRPQFEDLTRRFDVEWYGHAESTPEALSDFAGTARDILRGLGSRT
jgi:hypothetical protein